MSATLRSGLVRALRVPGPHVPGWFPLVAERADELAGPPRGVRHVELLGSRMELDTREYMQRRFFYHCYEADEVAFVRRWLRPGDRMVDVGAHIGIFTLLGAKAVGSAGSVDAFEPVPDTYAQLVRNVEANAYGWVTTHNAAVTSEPGTVTLGIPEERLVGYSTSDFTIGATLNAVEAPAVVLDDTLDLASPIRLLKMDAEGSEVAVLAGARRLLEDQPPDAILLEINHKTLGRHGSSTADVVAMLDGAGYRLHAIGRGGRLAKAPSIEVLRVASESWDATNEPRSKLRVGWATRHTMFNAIAISARAPDAR